MIDTMEFWDLDDNFYEDDDYLDSDGIGVFGEDVNE